MTSKKSLTTSKWIKLRKEIIQERDAICELCCYMPFTSIKAHHIIKRKDNPNLTYDKENILLVCDKCHYFLDHTKYFFDKDGLPITQVDFIKKRKELSPDDKKSKFRSLL